MDSKNEYGTLELQRSLLELLGDFDGFCKKEGIRYSLDSGSLLGAVRHKGFIPWDDDLDIVVDRDNYDRLIQRISNAGSLAIERITEDTLWTDRIRFRNTEFVGTYPPTIDVFILDHVPDGRLKATLKKYILFMLQGMIKYHLTLKKGSLFMKACALVTYLMGRPFSHATKYKWYHRVSQWGNKKETAFASCYNYPFEFIGIALPPRVLQKIVRVPFEDIEVSVMADYDSYLTALYGDYMTPPPVANRRPLHLEGEL